MFEKLKSRKLWAFVGVALLVLLNALFKLEMPKEDVLYLVIVSASYILGQGYVDAKQQPVKEFPIEDFTQSLTNIIQKELSKISLMETVPVESILDIVKTLVTQEIGKLRESEKTVNRELGKDSVDPIGKATS